MNTFFVALKNVALGFGKVILALVVVFIIYAAYGMYAESSATRKAASTCAAISPGDDASGLREKAISDGASDSQTRWIESDGIDTLFITFVGLPPFSRHICHINARDGYVISAELTYLD